MVERDPQRHTGTGDQRADRVGLEGTATVADHRASIHRHVNGEVLPKNGNVDGRSDVHVEVEQADIAQPHAVHRRGKRVLLLWFHLESQWRQRLGDQPGRLGTSSV